VAAQPRGRAPAPGQPVMAGSRGDVALPVAAATVGKPPRGSELEPPLGRVGDSKDITGRPVAQEEFGFGEVESRGHFEKTDRNLFDGQDLDVPTYLRKGIKILI